MRISLIFGDLRYIWDFCLIDFWRYHVLTMIVVPLIFGDIRYKYVSKNQWDISLAMDFIDFIDFQRYSLIAQLKFVYINKSAKVQMTIQIEISSKEVKIWFLLISQTIVKNTLLSWIGYLSGQFSWLRKFLTL